MNDDEVYHRHANCNCTLIYDSPGKERTTLWTKGDAAQQRQQQAAQEEKARKAKKTLQNFEKEHRATSADQLLPNYTQVEMPSSKLSGYSLNMNHPKGHNKAVAFRDALGYTVDNEDALKTAIQQGLSQYKAVEKATTKYGKQYEVKMLLSGPNGKQATVKTGWQIDVGQDTPRLINAYVYNEKKR